MTVRHDRPAPGAHLHQNAWERSLGGPPEASPIPPPPPWVIPGLSWVIEYPWGVWVTPGYPRLSVGYPWVIPGLSGGCEASYPEGVRPHIQRV